MNKDSDKINVFIIVGIIQDVSQKKYNTFILTGFITNIGTKC